MARNVVITGAASGVGFSAAKMFLELGDRVFMTDCKTERLKKAYKKLKKDAQKDMLHGKTTDVSKWEDVSALAQIVESLGGADVLANCACSSCVGLLHEADMEDYDYQFDVNIRGIFNTCKAFLPQMLQKKKGIVVNVSSVSGIEGDNNMPLYCASKGAIIALSRAMAMDYSKHGLRINTISPTAIKKPMLVMCTSKDVIEGITKNMPVRGLCEPEWCAEVIVYLASDQASHLCGINIPIYGGLCAGNQQMEQDIQT